MVAVALRATGTAWWPGQLVVRVRERVSADAQEVTENARTIGDLLWLRCAAPPGQQVVRATVFVDTITKHSSALCA